MPVIFLKSQLEFLRGNYQKAARVLNTAPQPLASLRSRLGEGLPMMYYNNLGIIHFHMRKPNLGAFYFRKAIEENLTAVRESRKSEGQLA